MTSFNLSLTRDVLVTRRQRHAVPLPTFRECHLIDDSSVRSFTSGTTGKCHLLDDTLVGAAGESRRGL